MKSLPRRKEDEAQLRWHRDPLNFIWVGWAVGLALSLIAIAVAGEAPTNGFWWSQLIAGLFLLVVWYVLRRMLQRPH